MAGSRRAVAAAGAPVALAALPVAVLAVFFLLPVAGIVVRGVDLSVLTTSRTWRAVGFTLWGSLAGTAASVLLGVPVAALLHRIRVPGARLWRSLALVPFVMPTVVVGIAFRELLGTAHGPLAIVCAFAFFNTAVVVRIVGASWGGLGSASVDAARIMGASPAQVWWNVTWPALRPAIVAAAQVVFLYCATSFGIVLMLGGLRWSTLETEIYLQALGFFDLRAASALALVQVLVVGLLLVVPGLGRLPGTRPRGRQPSPLRGSDRAVGTGDPSEPRRFQHGDVWLLGPALVAAALIVTPVVTLVVGSFRGGGAWTLSHYRALTDSGTPQLPVSVLAAARTSILGALLAMVIALVLGLCIAVVARRQRWLRAVFLLPLGVSAVIVGFGLLVTLDRPPLDVRDQWWLVPVAQAVVAMPVVVQLLDPVLSAVDGDLRRAAQTLGAGVWRTWWTVDAAALRRPVVAAAGLAFSIALGEFGATSFLSRSTSPTLPVLIYRLIGRPGEQNYGMALAGSVVLMALVTVVLLMAEWWPTGRRRRSLGPGA